MIAIPGIVLCALGFVQGTVQSRPVKVAIAGLFCCLFTDHLLAPRARRHQRGRRRARRLAQLAVLSEPARPRHRGARVRRRTPLRRARRRRRAVGRRRHRSGGAAGRGRGGGADGGDPSRGDLERHRLARRSGRDLDGERDRHGQPGRGGRAAQRPGARRWWSPRARCTATPATRPADESRPLAPRLAVRRLEGRRRARGRAGGARRRSRRRGRAAVRPHRPGPRSPVRAAAPGPRRSPRSSATGGGELKVGDLTVRRDLARRPRRRRGLPRAARPAPCPRAPTTSRRGARSPLGDVLGAASTRRAPDRGPRRPRSRAPARGRHCRISAATPARLAGDRLAPADRARRHTLPTCSPRHVRERSAK